MLKIDCLQFNVDLKGASTAPYPPGSTFEIENVHNRIIVATVTKVQGHYKPDENICKSKKLKWSV